jgi:hypothetical protein
VELYFHSLPSWRGAQGEHRDNFFPFYHYSALLMHTHFTSIYISLLVSI